MRCGECPLWGFFLETQCWRGRLWPSDPCKLSDHACDRSAWSLRAEANWHRRIAEALDKVAEMREREEANKHAR